MAGRGGFLETYLVCLSSWTIGIEQRSIHFDVAHVEELVIFKSVGATSFDIRLDIIEFTKASRKVEVSFVCEMSIPKYHNAVLESCVCQPSLSFAIVPR